MINVISLLFNLLEVKKGKIVFSNFNGRGYGCNPKYITEKLLGMRNLDIVWLSNSNNNEFPNGVRVVKWGSVKALYEWSTANVIVNNVRMGKYFDKGFKKKEGQIYIQTWHGSMGIKKMEADCRHLTNKYIYRSKLDSSFIDYLISNSDWLSQRYKESFFYNGEILSIGSPRNDIFFDKTNSRKIDKIRHEIGVPASVKILLYAPTFRDNGYESGVEIDWSKITNCLESKFGGKWVVGVRVHPNLSGKNLTSRTLDLSNYPDPQELLLITDCLITDYSSCAFDFVLTRRPVFLYVPDYADYITSRGLYYPLSSTPFSIAEDFNELIASIRNFNQIEYEKKTDAFLKAKISFDDGNASKRIADLIIKHIEQS